LWGEVSLLGNIAVQFCGMSFVWGGIDGGVKMEIIKKCNVCGNKFSIVLTDEVILKNERDNEAICLECSHTLYKEN